MSLLIKGFKMPKSCDDCDFIQHGVGDWCYITEKDLPCDCPLIELPDHGDLIDRDEQIERAWRLKLNTRELIAEMLNTATVVIPAERREE